jgi:hypothetical protein
LALAASRRDAGASCVVTVCLAAPAECSPSVSSGPSSADADWSFRPAASRAAVHGSQSRVSSACSCSLWQCVVASTGQCRSHPCPVERVSRFLRVRTDALGSDYFCSRACVCVCCGGWCKRERGSASDSIEHVGVISLSRSCLCICSFWKLR